MKTMTWEKGFVLFFSLLSFVVLMTFLDYGITWDEKLSQTNGFLTFRWYDTLGADRSALSTKDLFLYGSFFDTLSYVLGVISPLGAHETAHLLTAMFGLFGVFGVYKLGTLLGGARTGFFAALFLVLTPAFYGHLFNNPKDIPFASLFLWSLYFIFRYREELPEPRLKTVCFAALFTGLTLGVRIGGVLLFGYFVLAWMGWLFENHHYVRIKTDTKRFLKAFIPYLLMSWCLMLVFWPYAQVKPLIHPVLALFGNTHFDFNPLVMFESQFQQAKYLPWHYLPKWFSIRLPDFYFVALGAGALLSLFVRRKDLKWWLLIFTIVFPPIMAIMLRSTLYDGLRHFLFVIPPLSVLAALCVNELFEQPVHKLMRGTVLGMIGMSCLLTVKDMVSLHPYQYVYFNRTVSGGMQTASQKFDVDYWGHSVKEATKWVVNHYKDSAEVVGVGTCSDYSQVQYWIEKGQLTDRFSALSKKPHLYFHLTNKDCYYKEPGKVLHTIKRAGVPLLEVREIRRPG